MIEQLITLDTAIIARDKGFTISELVSVSKGYFKYGSGDDFYDMLLWCEGEDNPPEFGYAPTQAFLQKWLRLHHNIMIYILPVFSLDKCGYDSFKREHFRVVVTKGDCVYADHTTFEMHLPHSYVESLLSDDDDDETETYEEFLDRIDVVLYKDYEDALESGLLQGLKLIK